MERNRHGYARSEFSSPVREHAGMGFGRVASSVLRTVSGRGLSPGMESSGKKGKVVAIRLEPIPSHTCDVVKIQHQISRFQNGSSLHNRSSKSLFNISIKIPKLPSHPERKILNPLDSQELWGEKEGRMEEKSPIGRKFNSPYTEAEEELERKETPALSEVLTQLSSGPKQLTTSNFEESLARTDSVPKYHEFQFKLLTDDPLLKGLNGSLIRWKAGCTLGQGTMGQVLKAFNIATGELFAVKRLIFNEENSDQNEFVKNLETEIAILSRLEHPNIVKYLGSERVYGSLCTYLEYLSGGSLTHILDSFGPLRETVGRAYLRQVMQGLEYLHRNGIVHRDIKCANILVDGEGIVKLSDFGSSVKYDLQQSDLTSLKGSILWMAPEVMKQSGYGRKADIWSLGCFFGNMEIELVPGVTIEARDISPNERVYIVKNRTSDRARATVEIEGNGWEIDRHRGETRVSVAVQGGTEEVLARVNLEQGGNIDPTFAVSFHNTEPTNERYHIERIQQLCQDLCRKLTLLDLSELRLRDRQIPHFVDPYFPPCFKSISNGTNHQDMIGDAHWKRPKDFFHNDFNVFVKEIEPSDIRQGQLRDCWILSSLSSLAERPQLVRRLFLSENMEAGIYRVKLCKDGEWQIVTLDDYFPCIPFQGPVFSHSIENELWVLLLEKAFAKLVGSYSLLCDGYPHEALSDLTGCPTATYLFSDLKDKEDFWGKLLAWDIHGALITANTSQEDRGIEEQLRDNEGGLVLQHAYTVLHVKQARGNQMLCIRNPMAMFEWRGDWSDRSPLWTEEMKAELKPVLDENDGTFWMSYADFLKHFVSVSLCFPETFHEARLKGKFLRMRMEDGRSTVLSKFYYCLKILENSRVFFGVHQEDNRVLGAKEKRAYLDLSILVFKRNQPGTPPTLVHCEPMRIDRQLEVEMELQPGEYFIVPKTSGCALRRPINAVAENLSLLTTSNRLTPLALSTFRDVFRKYDMMISGDLSFAELSVLYQSAALNLSEEEFGQIKENYSSTPNGLTCEGFLDLMEHRTVTIGEESTWRFLEHLGYDRDLYSVKSRVFIFTVHSKQLFSLEVKDNTMSDLANIGLVEYIRANREPIYQNGSLSLTTSREDYFGTGIVTYLIRNNDVGPITVEVNMSNGQNIAVSTLEMVNRVRIEGNQGKIALHAQISPTSVLRPSLVIL